MPEAAGHAMHDTLHRGNVATVIPALNEALRIRGVVEGALRHCDQVILIDDGSDDDTLERIEGLPVTVLRHAQRMGKGASLRDGFRAALDLGAKAVLTMDGDGQHSADDIPRLIEAGNHHPNCIVIGARLRKRSQQPTYRRLANEFGDWGIGWGCGFRIADSQSGQRLYPAPVAALNDVPGEDFVFEAQILMSASHQLGVRCVSVPIDFLHHDETLFSIDLHRERGPAAGAERGVAVLNRRFDVMRIVVPAPDDEQILESARDKELAAIDKAEIAGS
jgi:glycosyltransferase involved in cell wall biosynthesis